MAKHLIINADDFGMCHSSNLAVIELLEEGAITSSTVMAPCPWFPEAAAYACAHPEKCIGLHLTLTSEWARYRWGPVTREGAGSLLKAGYFPQDVLSVEQNSRPEDVEREIRAQLGLARAWGFEPTHLDNHMGSLYGLVGVQTHLPLVFRICAENGFPFRLPTRFQAGDAIGEALPPAAVEMMHQMKQAAAAAGVPVLDCLVSYPFEKLPGETYESFRQMVCDRLALLPEGIHEIYIHPAVDSPEIRAINPEWEKRTWELCLFRDPLVKAAIVQAGIQLISWRDVRRLRGM